MIRCAKCGAVNPADAVFCVECNSYLEWSGEPLEEVGQPSEGTGEAGSDATLSEVRPDSRDVAPPPIAASVASAPSGTQPGSRQPAKAAPVSPVRQREQGPPSAERPKPGETVCRSCGAGNAPTRRFCRRCGQSLVETSAPTPWPTHWYQRLIRRNRRPAYLAGQRPTRVRPRWRPGCLGVTVGLIVLLAAGAIAGYVYVEGIP